MTCLVYGIVREHAHLYGSLPQIGGTDSMRLVAENGLAAAISRVSELDAAPSVLRLRTFAAVVQALHDACTVLPMRYGCLFRTEKEVAALLGERGPEFAAALDAVEGCAEMCVRAMVDERSRASAPALSDREPARAPGGRAYLAARQEEYARQTLSAQAATAIGERAAAVFRGLFVRYVSVYSPQASVPYNAPMLSLYFLVKRPRVETFSEIFRMLEFSEPAKLLLSGPWPPYNFVQPAGGAAA